MVNIMTAMYKKYTEVLKIENSVDYWSDQAIDEAVQYLEGFDNSDWHELLQVMDGSSVEWKTRCAETMSETAFEKAMPILISLLSSSDESVLEAVIDSLNSFKRSGETINLSKIDKALLESFAAREGLIGTVTRHLLKD